MKPKDFSEDKVLWELRSKGLGIKDKVLTVESGSLGLKSLAKLDFLVNYKGYDVYFRRKN